MGALEEMFPLIWVFFKGSGDGVEGRRNSHPLLHRGTRFSIYCDRVGHEETVTVFEV
jgi:hypothetical protein